MHISLRPNEKIYINGAVIRVDRKVCLELLNDATFLLEAHVMLAKDATTPLRQLYFIVQMLLMDAGSASAAREMFGRSMRVMLASYESPPLVTGLKRVEALVATGKTFEALKMIRTLLPLEPPLTGEATPSAKAS
jgi:flagellar protein FlbT